MVWQGWRNRRKGASTPAGSGRMKGLTVTLITGTAGGTGHYSGCGQEI
jgi:hypothetical protein